MSVIEEIAALWLLLLSGGLVALARRLDGLAMRTGKLETTFERIEGRLNELATAHQIGREVREAVRDALAPPVGPQDRSTHFHGPARIDGPVAGGNINDPPKNAA